MSLYLIVNLLSIYRIKKKKIFKTFKEQTDPDSITVLIMTMDFFCLNSTSEITRFRPNYSIICLHKFCG